MKTKQKFHMGDWVWIGKNPGPWCDHFTDECEGVVIGSYADQYGGDSRDSYTIHIKGQGRTSWYRESQLSLIESCRPDKLMAWEQEEDEQDRQHSDLDWIFENGEEVLSEGYGASVQALASCFGMTNLWGSRGEGMTYYSNARVTLDLATEHLKSGDKEGWLARCEVLKKELARTT